MRAPELIWRAWRDLQGRPGDDVSANMATYSAGATPLDPGVVESLAGFIRAAAN